MIEGKQDLNFKNDSPEVWKQIQKNNYGSIYQKNILFTYNKIYPNGNSDKNYYWIIFTKLDISGYEYKNDLIFFQRILLLAIVALLLSIIYSNSRYAEYEYSKILLEKNKELNNKNKDNNILLVLFFVLAVSKKTTKSQETKTTNKLTKLSNVKDSIYRRISFLWCCYKCININLV